MNSLWLIIQNGCKSTRFFKGSNFPQHRVPDKKLLMAGQLTLEREADVPEL